MNGNSSAIAGNSTGPLRSVEVSPTDAAIALVSQEQSETFELLNLLQQRLEKVLGPEPPMDKSDRPSAEANTPLLTAIEGRYESAQAINNRLRWIMDRVVL